MVLPRSEGEPEGEKMSSASGGEEGDNSTSTVAMDSPNSNQNVTKVTLSSSLSGSDIQETRLDLSLEGTEAEEAGADNPAFEADEAMDNSKNLNGGTHLEKEAEAVNFELVHMAPYANGNGYNSPGSGGVPGIPVKKEIEAEASTPYDEYFVPVNEHRKYMRGEKLYVTKDKRKTSSWKRCCSWVAGCSVLGAIIIVAILAGTGVISMQEPGIVQEASIGRGFAGNALPTSDSRSSSSTPIPTSATNSSFSPTTDMSYMYVPRSLEGELRLDNIDMNATLQDPSSEHYKLLASDLEERIKNILFSQNILKYGSADINLKVTGFRSGSVVVTYRLAWTFMPGIRNPPDPITMEDLMRKIQEELQKNDGYIGQYHVDETSLKVANVMDSCQLDVTGCPGHCEFDYKSTLRSICICPENQRWDDTLKVCEVEPEVAPEPEPSAEPAPHPESAAEPEPNPEPAAELEPHPETAAEPTSHPEPTAEPEPHPEPAAEPTSHPEPSAEPTPHPEPAAEPTSHPEPAAEPEPHPEPAAEPEPHPEPSAEPTPHPEPAAEPEPHPEPAAEPEPHPEPSAEPTPHPEPSAEPTPHPEPAAEPEPHPEPAAASTSHPEPSAEPTPHPEPAAEPTSHPEPAAEPTPHPESVAEPTALPEPVAEPTALPEPAAEPISHPEPSVEPQPSAEPTPQPEPAPEPSAHLQSDPVSATVATTTEPQLNAKMVEGTTERFVYRMDTASSSSGAGMSEHTIIADPTAEPIAEPTPTPSSASVHPTTATITEMKSNLNLASEITAEHQPGTTPTPMTLMELSTDATSIKGMGKGADASDMPSSKSELEVLASPTTNPDVEEITAKENAEGITEMIGRLRNAVVTEPVEAVTEAGSELKYSKSTTQSATTEAIHPERATVLGLVEQPKSDSSITEVFGSSSPLGKESTTVKTTPSFAENYKTELENEHLNSVGNDVYDNLAAEKYTIRDKYTDKYELATSKHQRENEKEIVISEQNLDKISLSDANPHLFPSTEPYTSSDDHGYENKEKYKKDKYQKKEFKKKTKDGKNFELGEIGNAKNDVEVLVSSTEAPAVVTSTNPLAENINVENVNQSEVTTTSNIATVEQSASGRSMGNLADETMLPIKTELSEHITTSKPVEVEISGTTDVTPTTTIYEPVGATEVNTVPNLFSSSSQPEEKKLQENADLLETEIQPTPVPSQTSDPAASESKKSEEEIMATTLGPSTDNQESTNPKTDSLGGLISSQDDSFPTTVTFPSETSTDAPTIMPILESHSHSSDLLSSVDGKIDVPTTMQPSELANDPSSTTTSLSDQKGSDFAFSATTIATPSSEDDSLKSTTIPTPSQFSLQDASAITAMPSPPSMDTAEGSDTTVSSPASQPQTSAAATTLPPPSQSWDTAQDSLVLTTILPPSSLQSLGEPSSVTTVAAPRETELQDLTTLSPQTSSVDKEASVPITAATPVESRVSEETVANASHPSTEDISGFFFKCASGQFECRNGTNGRGSVCVPMSSKCDSINDCSDGSDEVGCIEQGCPGNFQCADGLCLNRHMVCNGIPDCSDGSDEQKCGEWKCEFDEFRCPSGRCIPVVWQCDGKPDCEGHSDEFNCQDTCGNDEFLCPERWCIPMTYRCNGAKECANGEDEQLCDCSVDQFKCESGGCVAKSAVCDGIDHCPDRSDEWRCIKIDNTTKLLQVRSSEGTYKAVCSDYWNPAESDLACRSLGYSHSLSSDIPVSSTNTSEPNLILNGTSTKSLLVNLVPNQAVCQSERFVQVNCQDFSCGSQSISEGVAARMIEGGTMAGQLPSVALLYNTKNTQSCTASIISPRWAIASYNCLLVRNKNVAVEDWRLWSGSTKYEPGVSEGSNVSSIVPYPQAHFNQFLYDNDVALVEVTGALTFSQSTGAVCLPNKELEPRQLCVTAGWGVSSNNDGSLTQYLNYLPVPTTDLETCNSTKFYPGLITKDKICAGYTDTARSLCSDDEGAPLMCVNQVGVWELRGVLSYHKNCGRGSRPSIFSNVSSVRKWIEETTGTVYRYLSNVSGQR